MNTNDIRVCFVGDSFVNGTCDPEGLGWAGRVIARAQSGACELTYYNLGIRGETSQMIYSRWYDECKKRLPDHSDNRIVFSFGVNDTTLENGMPRVEIDSSIQTVKEILVKARVDYKVLFIGPPPIDDIEQNKRIAQLDNEYARLCDELGIPYLSVYASLLGNPVWMTEVSNNDGAHPGSGGYAAFAQLVNGWAGWWFNQS